MGLFSKKSNSEQQAEQAPREETAPAAAPLPDQGPLRNLVEKLLADGAEGGRLTLIQRGNVMHQQTERSVNGSTETDGATVDQAHPLFEDVAALYTESMSQESGAWQTAVIAAGQGADGVRTVQVDYDYPSAPHKTEVYQLDGQADAAHDAGDGGVAGAAGGAGGAAAAGDAAQGQNTQGAGEQTAAEGSADGSGERTGSTSADAQREATAQDDAASRGDSGAGRTPEQSRGTDHSGAESGAGQGASTAAVVGAGVGGGALAAAAAQGRREESAEAGNPNGAATHQEGHGPGVDSRPGSEPAVNQQQSSAQRPETGAADAAPAGSGAQRDPNALPDHVDHDEWRDDNAGRSGGQTTGAAAAGAAAGAGARGTGGGEADAPSVARGADVAPSYKAGAAGGRAPSSDRLADGNKVLTEADVLGRLSAAQKHLFGSEGTALEVSTVLIRVRTLGSYYDALTHVRQGGFWDQRGTFDLVSEDLLKVQELKEDSYVEGEGAPLAVMYRFRPGIPPEVSFDYSDEEAFVRYEERLPSQNYVEELRMYPRTGSNIPAHVNEALQDWNY